VNGNNYVGIGSDVLMLNVPFWLFFIAIAVNLYFIFRLQRSKETKQNPS
jgi:predicted RND superfamily exporter protein